MPAGHGGEIPARRLSRGTHRHRRRAFGRPHRTSHERRRRDPAAGSGDALITAVGTRRGLDETLIPERGYPLELIPPVPLPRKLNLGSGCGRRPGCPARCGQPVRCCGRLRADVLVGFGSYVALPSYLAARRDGHPDRGARGQCPRRRGEPDRRPADHRRVHRLGRGPAAARPAIGMPLRPAILDLDRAGEAGPAARARFGLHPELPTLLVTGGSQGARAINHAVLGAQRELAEAGVQVLHIPGPRATRSPLPTAGPDGPAHQVVLPYLSRDGRRVRGRRLRAVPVRRHDGGRADRGRVAGLLRAAATARRRAGAECPFRW